MQTSLYTVRRSSLLIVPAGKTSATWAYILAPRPGPIPPPFTWIVHTDRSFEVLLAQQKLHMPKEGTSQRMSQAHVSHDKWQGVDSAV